MAEYKYSAKNCNPKKCVVLFGGGIKRVFSALVVVGESE